MVETTFILDNTTREQFESWLVRKWPRLVSYPTRADGENYLQPARRQRDMVTIEGGYVSVPNEQDEQTMFPYGWVIAFYAIPLDNSRIEVTAKCSSDYAEPAYLELLALIGARYPSSGLADLQAPAVDAAPEVITSEETTAEPGVAPDEDDIPRFGRRRDLSTNEVRNIVKRCKAYKALPGGSIAKFHDHQSRNWPDPEDSPKGYALKTLENWMRDERFH